MASHFLDKTFAPVQHIVSVAPEDPVRLNQLHARHHDAQLPSGQP